MTRIIAILLACLTVSVRAEVILPPSAEVRASLSVATADSKIETVSVKTQSVVLRVEQLQIMIEQIKSGIIPVDVLIDALRSHQIPISLMSEVIASGVLPMEILGELIQFGSVPISIVAEAVNNGVLPMSVLSDLVQSKSISIEMLVGAINSYQIPLSIIADAVKSGALPIEVLLSGTVQLSPSEWFVIAQIINSQIKTMELTRLLPLSFSGGESMLLRLQVEGDLFDSSPVGLALKNAKPEDVERLKELIEKANERRKIFSP